MFFSYNYLFIFSLLMGLFIADVPEVEKKTINDIDFRFTLDDNNILVKGTFVVEAQASCPKFITYDFGHKKNYTKTLSTFEKEKGGDNWYDIHFIIEKYMFAKIESFWRYSLDDVNNRVNFELRSYDINISGLNLVDSSEGYFEFIQEGDMTRINYFLDYRLKPTRLKSYMYKIQKKESIKILSDYKSYLEDTCPL